MSPCPLPCATTSTETRFVSEVVLREGRRQNMLALIQLSQAVEVTTTSLVQPTFTSLLSSVGGSMGLWLGLGVLQTIELVINFVLL